MKSLIKLFIVSLYLLSTLSYVKSEIKQASDNLLFVYSHFRHGSRYSSKLNKNGTDFFNETYIGDGELNQIGIRMNYLIGLRNKKRYGNLLSKTYDPREIFILSTDVNRTLLSAMSQMMGMYKTDEINSDIALNLSIPPVFDNESDSEVLKEGLKLLGKYSLPGKSNVIPIHGMVDDVNRHLCTRLKSFRKNNSKISNITEYLEYFNNTYADKLISLFNIKKSNYFTELGGVINICDQFISSLYEGKLQKMKILEDKDIDLKQFESDCNNAIKLKYRYLENGDSEYVAVRVKMSRIMKDMIKFMETKINDDKNNDIDISKYAFNDYSRPKMFFLSGHESTVAPMEIYLQLALNITDYFHVKFGSNMFFELYKKEGEIKGNLNDYYVEYYFDNKFVHKWDFDEFKENILKVAWDEDKIDNYCSENKDNKNSKMSYKILFIVSIVVLCIAIIVLVFCCYSKKNNINASSNIEQYSSQVQNMNQFSLM